MAEGGQQQGGQQQGGQQQGGQQQGGGAPPGQGLTYDGWLAQQQADVQTMIGEHETGLRTALQSEREQRRQFEKELREAAKKLDEGSEARTRMEKMANDLDGMSRQAGFYEAAHAAGVTNLKLAWLAVQQDASLSDARGNVDMKRLQESYPELFGKPAGTAAGNAGGGTGTPPPGGKVDMDTFIRRKAGVVA